MNSGDLISGKYRLLHQLGAGGMGSVWAARNELTDRDFAVKFLLPDLAQNKEALQRFFHEAKACGQIRHPAVVNVYDMGQAENGAPYLVMELLEGEGFDQRLARSKAFRPGEAAAWLAFIARGLEEAHMRGLVHRDLKPGNIFFAFDERGDVLPKLLDFGVSKAVGNNSDDFVKTTTGAVLGSPAYMSPEQAKGETEIDHRSDIWSLGVILYECLTGQVPFDAPNYNALMVTIMMKPHKSVLEIDPSIPVELSEIVDLAMAKDREDRIHTARELADRLEAIVPRITHSEFAYLQTRSFDQTATTRFRSVPPPKEKPASTAAATTQGTWSDVHSARTRRKPSSLIWLSVATLGAVLVAAVILVVMRMQPSEVAVAGRAEIAMVSGLARLQRQLDELAQEGEAKTKDAPETDDQEGLRLAPEDLPSAKRPRRIAPSTSKKGAKDPHGGVNSSGL